MATAAGLLAHLLSFVVVVRCNACQCTDLTTVQRTKLWQLSQQSCHRCCTNAFDITQKLADIGMVLLEVRCIWPGGPHL